MEEQIGVSWILPGHKLENIKKLSGSKDYAQLFHMF